MRDPRVVEPPDAPDGPRPEERLARALDEEVVEDEELVEVALAGLGLADLSPGGWIAECVSSSSAGQGVAAGLLGMSTGLAFAWGVFAIWYVWWMSVGVRRARMEDAALRKEFGTEWDKYARTVHWWFFPGLL